MHSSVCYITKAPDKTAIMAEVGGSGAVFMSTISCPFLGLNPLGNLKI